MMCSHIWTKVNDILICKKCALNLLPDGTLFFDKKIINYKSKKRKVKK